MNLTKKFSDSYLARGLDYMFAPKYFGDFKDTFWGRIFNFSFQPLAEALIVLSFVLLAYKMVLPAQTASVAPFLIILALIFLDKKKIRITKPLIWILIFFAFTTLSAALAVFFGANFAMIATGWLLWLQFVILIFSGMAIETKKLFYILPIVILPISIYGIYQYFFSHLTTVLWVSDLENIPLRAFSVVGDPNVFGMLSGIGLVTSMILGLKGKKIFWPSVVVFASAIVLSYSRTTWLSLLVALVFAVGLAFPKYLIYSPLALLVLFIGKVRERILVVFNPAFLNSSSLDGRIWTTNNAWFIWEKAPLFGFGPGSYGGVIARDYASPVYHLGLQNGYVALYFTDGQWLETLVQTGIFGLLSLVGFFISTIWAQVQLWFQGKNLYVLGGLIFSIFLITSCFTSNIIEFSMIIMPVSLIIGSTINEV